METTNAAHNITTFSSQISSNGNYVREYCAKGNVVKVTTWEMLSGVVQEMTLTRLEAVKFWHHSLKMGYVVSK